jgi:hypothetical protein
MDTAALRRRFFVGKEGPAPLAQRGVWPYAVARAKGCVRFAQGAKALVGGLKFIVGASLYKTFTIALAGEGKTGKPPCGR